MLLHHGSDTLDDCAAILTRAPDDALARELRSAGTWQRFLSLAVELSSQYPIADVIVVDDTEYGALGAAYAVATGRRLIRAQKLFSGVEALVAASEALRSVAIVAAPEALEARLYRLLLEAEPAMGVLTGATSRRLSAFLRRLQAPRSDEKVRCQQFATGQPPSWLPPQVQFYPFELLAERLASSGRERVWTSIATHGDEIDAYLGQYVLCGRTDDSHSLGGTHTCLNDGHCPRNPTGERRLLPINQLNSELLVLESCSSAAAAESVLPRSLHLLLSAVRAPLLALIASPKLLRPSFLPFSIVSSLLLEGCTLGEAVSIATRAHSTFSGDRPSFLLIGDPTFRMSNARRISQSCAVWDHAPSGQHFASVVASGPVSRLDISHLPPDIVASPSLSPSAHSVLTLPVNTPHGGRELVTIQREPGAVSIRLDPQTDAMVALSKFLAIGKRLARGTRSAAHFARVLSDSPSGSNRAAGATLAQISQEGEEILAFIAQLCRELKSGFGSVAPDSMVDYLNERVAALDDAFVICIGKTNPESMITPVIARWLQSSAPERQITCARCKNGSGYEVDFSDIFSHELMRQVVHCIQCGLIADRTPNGLHATLSMTTESPPGDGAIVNILLTSSSEDDVDLHVFAMQEGQLPWCTLSFDLPVRRITVPAQSTTKITGCARFATAPSGGVYTVLITLCSALEFSVYPQRIAI